MAELNRRLKLNEDIVYPITRQENIIDLQKTITEKLPIVSSSAPQGVVPTRQVWLDISEQGNNGQQSGLRFGSHSEGQLSFGNQQGELHFGSQEQEQSGELHFGQQSGELHFGANEQVSTITEDSENNN